MAFQRWLLETFDGSESYRFPINPNTQSSPIPTQALTYYYTPGAYQGGFTAIRSPRAPVQWSFSGVLYDTEHYDAMIAWIAKGKVRLTTDLGEILQVRLTQFLPERAAPQRPRHPFRHKYQVKALIYFYNYGQV